MAPTQMQKLVQSSSYDYHLRPWGKGRILFEQGRFALVAQTLVDEQTMLSIVTSFYNKETKKSNILVMLLPHAVQPRMVKPYAKVMQQILVRMDELVQTGWLVYYQSQEIGIKEDLTYGVLGDKSDSQRIKLYNTHAYGCPSQSKRNTRALKNLLKTLQNAAETAADRKPSKNSKVLDELEIFFKKGAEEELAKSVHKLYPDLPLEEAVALLGRAQDQLRTGPAAPAVDVVKSAARQAQAG